MERQHVLETLGDWVTFLWQALPKKLRPTLWELLIGCIVSRSGHLSEALMAIGIHRHWNTYYKAIQKGVYSWLALARQWILLLLRTLQLEEVFLAIDDTCTPRSSRKAPGVAHHHDHAHKPNRPTYLWGQLSVWLALIWVSPHRTGALPLLHRLIRNRGNRSKLKAASCLIQLFRRWAGKGRPVRVLLDAWYMKGPLVKRILAEGFAVIGQVRRDTVCTAAVPETNTPKRGRPAKYGPRLTWDVVTSRYACQEATIQAYGQERLFQLYPFTAQVRFLSGRWCRLVWCRFQQDNDSWTKWCLLLSTDPEIAPERIIRVYALRWWVEPLFNELKHLFGLASIWQQTRQALARWSFLVILSHGLSKLLTLCCGPEVAKVLCPIPWRMKQPATAGWMARALGSLFRQVRVRDCWDRKTQKIRYPQEFLEPPFQKTA